MADEAELAAWVDAHAARLYRAAALFTSEAEAADLCQEVFLVAARRRGAFDGRSAPYTWLYGILCNLVRDRRKKRARRQLRLVPAPSATGDLTRDVAAREDRARVRAAVAALPEEQREVVVCFYLDELSVAETAARMGLAPGTVKSRLFAARRQLRRALEGGR